MAGGWQHGYDFLQKVGGLFIDPSGERPLTEFYTEFTGEGRGYAEVALEKEQLVLAELLGSEVNRLTETMLLICERHRRYRDYTRREIRAALRGVAACFGVYRTYVRPRAGVVRQEDRAVILKTLERAREVSADVEPDLFQFIGKILLLEIKGDLETEFISRFQQLTGPVAAKGVEDTAFYCFNRLTGLNEVGGDPGAFGTPLEVFHQDMTERARREPHAMLTTSTHDTKRSEDVRARLALLSEIPQAWAQAVRRWASLNERHRVDGGPDRNTEYLLYQTLVGAWSIEAERVQAFMLKAAREAKTNTSWTNPDTAYEAALERFIHLALQDPGFLADLDAFAAPLIRLGRVKALAQVLIKLTAPGIPDIYQGCELWEHSLVDSDNRRPVDFEVRRRLIAQMRDLSPGEILAGMKKGLPKLWVTQQTLRLREQLESVFSSGSYTPLEIHGARAACVIGFRRGEKALTIVPRFTQRLVEGWGDTCVAVPEGRWRHAFTGMSLQGGEVAAEDLFTPFPVALLWRP